MKRLNPDKLHVTLLPGTPSITGNMPRRYTLTHSDFTGDLFLTIGNDYDKKQISGLYTRLMRDEVLAELLNIGDCPEFRVYCHVSGGLVFGTARLRDGIFHAELSRVMEAIRYGDRAFFEAAPDLDKTPVKIYFHSSKSKYDRCESWGTMADYR